MNRKKLFAMLLAVVMVFSVGSMTAFAGVEDLNTDGKYDFSTKMTYETVIKTTSKQVATDGITVLRTMRNETKTFGVDISDPTVQAYIEQEYDAASEDCLTSVYVEPSEGLAAGQYTVAESSETTYTSIYVKKDGKELVFTDVDDLIQEYINQGDLSHTLIVVNHTVYTIDATYCAEQYDIISGANGVYTKDSGSDRTVIVDADFAKFSGVKLDGTLLAADKYTAISGSTVVTLKGSFLDTLATGDHALTILFTDGEAATTLKVSEGTPEPQPVSTIKLNGATLSFKPGEEPKFTAESAEPDKYWVYVEMWSEVGGDKYITSSDFFNRDEDLLIKQFEEGKEYTYNVWVKPTDVYADNGDFLYYATTLSGCNKLVLNGVEITITPEMTEDMEEAGIWLNKVASFTAEKAADPGTTAPGTTDPGHIKDDVPTGDENSVGMMLVLMMTAFASACGIVLTLRKKESR